MLRARRLARQEAGNYDDVYDKFVRLASPLMPAPRIAEYRARFEKIETEPRVDWLLGSFNPQD